MDVELPDGTVIEGVPEGTTKTQLIAKLKSSGYDVAPLTSSIFETKEMPTTGEEALSNLLDVGTLIGGGAALAARQYAKPVMEGKPLEPLAEAGRAAIGLPILAGQAAMGDVAARQQLRELPANLAQDYRQAYGSPEQAYRTAVMTPGRFATDISLTPSMLRAAEIAAPKLPMAMAARGINRLAEPILGPIFNPEQTAANRLVQSLAGAPEQAAEAMRAPVPVTPGAPPATASQRLAAAGMTEPGVAGLEASYMDINAPEGMRIYQQEQQRVNAIQNQIKRIDEDLKTRAADMSPDEVAQLRAVRDQLNQSLAAEQATMTTQAQGVATRLPETGQRVPGAAVSERTESLQQQFRREVVTPAYERAFRSAGNAARIDVSNVLDQAATILGRPLSFYDVSTTPQVARRLSRLERTPTPGEFVSLGEYGGYSAEPSGGFQPVNVNLREADAIRKAINNEIGAINETAPDAQVKLRQLNELHRNIDAAVQNSPISPTAKQQYNQALATYRGQYVPRFKTGIVSDILRTTIKNQPGLLPDNVVKNFIANETNAQQFVTTYGNDPAARQAMLTGVRDLARKSIVDPTTRMVVPEKIDEFLAQNGRQLNIMGVDAQSVLQPIREEAIRLQNGMDQLQRQATAARQATVTEVVDTALKSRPNMDFLTRRLDNNGLEALRKEVSDRALNAINRGDTKEALDYLTKNRRTVQMAIGEDAYRDIRGLADAQRNLEEIAKSAPKPDKSIVVDIGNSFTREELTDYRVLADEIRRLKEVENLSGVGTARGFDVAAEQAEQAGVSPKRIPPYLSAKVTTLKSFADKILNYGNKRVAAVLIDALYDNPERGAALIEQAMAAKRTRPMLPSPEISAPARRERNALAPIIGSVQIQNAMNRQQAR